MGRKKSFRGSLGDTVREREFEVLGEELLDVWALDVVGLLELNHFEDLPKQVSSHRLERDERMVYVNRPEPGTMPRRHVLVQCVHSFRPRHLPILLVHVVRSRARVVADPDTEVLDFLRAFLMYLKQEQCFSHHGFPIFLNQWHSYPAAVVGS